MNRRAKKTMRFAGRSLMWSLLLFAVVMSLLNWGELHSAINGRYVVVSSSSDTTLYRIGPAAIETIQKILEAPHTFLKTF